MWLCAKTLGYSQLLIIFFIEDIKLKYLTFTVLGIIFISCSSGLVTVSRDSNLDNKSFSNKNIIVCPLTGEWFFLGKDTSFYVSPEAKLYTKAFTIKLKELRPCIKVIDQSRLDYSAPDLERSMNMRKYCFSNMTKEDSTFFNNLSTTFNADYLIFFESVEFFSDQKYYYQIPLSQKESELILQLWDLKQSKMVYRVQSGGNSSIIENLFQNDGSNEAVENSFVEYIESLPLCSQ